MLYLAQFAAGFEIGEILILFDQVLGIVTLKNLSVGVRYPTTFGYLLIAPLLCVLGLPGEAEYEWASGTSGKAIYITALACIGIANNLVNATGAVECACKLIYRIQCTEQG